jgi:hypothetical protein
VPLPPEVEKTFKAKKIEIRKILGSGTLTSQQQQELEAYFDQYTFARWKDLNQAHLTTDFHTDLSSDLSWSKTGAAHDWLVNRSLAFFTELVNEPNYHPAVRVNAMLVIGNLNQRDPTSFGENPVPLPAAIPVLLQAIADENQVDAVKVAALRGIIYHVTLGVADPNVLNNQIVPAMIQLAASKVESGRSAEGHGWMRVLAIEALAAAGVLGDQQDPAKVPKLLAEIVAEKEAQMFTRCAAARALGKLRYPNGLGLDPVRLAVALGALATESTTAELERAKEEAVAVAIPAAIAGRFSRSSSEDGEEEDYSGDDDDDDSSGGLFRTFPQGAVMPGAPVAPAVEAPTAPLRRRLKTGLEAVWEGLAGNDPSTAHHLWRPPDGGVRTQTVGVSLLAAAPYQQAFIDSLLAKLKALMDACDNKEAIQTELVTSLQTALDELGRAVASPPVAAPAGEQAAPQ